MDVAREDRGYVVAGVVAVVALVALWIATGGSGSGDRDDAATATTDPPPVVTVQPGGLVRIQSPAASGVPWGTSEGSFRIDCEGGRVTLLEAQLTDLPDRRYAWRVTTAAGDRTRPLNAFPMIEAELLEGDGLSGGFTPVDGEALTRFTFADDEAPPIERLALTVPRATRHNPHVISPPAGACA